MSFDNDRRLRKPAGTGRKYQVTAEYSNVYVSERPDSSIATQVLLGETVIAYQTSTNLFLVQLIRDNYVGWLDKEALSSNVGEPNSKITARLAVSYQLPDLKSRPIKSLSFGVLTQIGREESEFGFCPEVGWISKQHYEKLDCYSHDPVEVAKKYLNAPYQWGGRDSRGIDCSGLVQQAFEACNVLLLRDTDMQFASSEQKLEWSETIDLERNDLIFWKGHVAIVIDKRTIIHASAKHMAVVEESLSSAVTRIAQTDGFPTGVIRIKI